MLGKDIDYGYAKWCTILMNSRIMLRRINTLRRFYCAKTGSPHFRVNYHTVNIISSLIDIIVFLPKKPTAWLFFSESF